MGTNGRGGYARKKGSRLPIQSFEAKGRPPVNPCAAGLPDQVRAFLQRYHEPKDTKNMKTPPALARQAALAGLCAAAALLVPMVAVAQQGKTETGTQGDFAIATNPDYVGYFVASGPRMAETAGRDAMRLCKRRTDSACELALVGRGGFLAIGHGPDGSLNFTARKTRQAALAAFDEQCTKSFGGHCTQEHVLDLGARQVVEAPVEPRRHAALAFQASGDMPMAKDNRIWLATGRSTADEAIAAAMQRCVAALSGGDCRHISTSGQTYIALYRNADGNSGGIQINLSEQLAIGAVDRVCRADGVRCEIVAIKAARELSDREYDLRAMKGVPL